MTVAYAPAKIILFGEHAVVYGRPAIAVPVTQLQARATVEPGNQGQGIVIAATDLGRVLSVDKTTDPLQAIVASTLEYLQLGLCHDLTVTVESAIPIARGLGSGAAVSTAMATALAQYFSRELTAREVSRLVYETERLYHGTPSGIDNTVIAYQRPVYFIRDRKPQTIQVGRRLVFLIADTGVESPTAAVVSAVRQAWEASTDEYEVLFDRVGDIVMTARRAIEKGDLEQTGLCMDENHRLLGMMGVSSPHLDILVNTAKRSGALGAKLSGAGRGGNIIALVTPRSCQRAKAALEEEGAHAVTQTALDASTEPKPGLVPERALT